MLLEEQYDMIESYVSGTLDAQGVQHVEDMCAQSTEWTEALADEKLVQSAVLDSNFEDLRTQMDRDLEMHLRPQSTGKGKYLAFGATIIGLISLFVYLSPDSSPNNSATPPVQQSEESQTISKNSIKTVDDTEPSMIQEGSPTPIVEQPTVISTSPEEPLQLQDDKGTVDKTETSPLTEYQPEAESIDDVGKETLKEAKTALIDPVKPAPCKTLTPNVMTAPSCLDSPTGTIYITPSSLGPDNENMVITMNGQSKIKSFAADNLEAGAHTLSIVDGAGCLTKIDFDVDSKPCSKASNTLSFNPENGELTILNYVELDSELEITSMNGIKTSSTLLETGDPATWNGQGQDGVLVPSGTYFYTLKSSGSKTSTGYINVTR